MTKIARYISIYTPPQDKRGCEWCGVLHHIQRCPAIAFYDPPIDPLPTDAPGGDDEETGPYAFV